jgi:HK97 family phage prohead protease
MNFASLKLRIETKSVNDDKAEFVGVASTSDVDLGQDIIEPGAFGKSLGNIVLLRDHNPSKVIGVLSEFEQDGKNLRVAGEIGFDSDTARETYALMKRGYLSGISPGFVIAKGGAHWDEQTQIRHITKARMLECSIVAIPANQRARVRDVKSLLKQVGTRDFLFDLGFEDDDVDVLMTKGFDALMRGDGKSSASFLSPPPPVTEDTPAFIAQVRDLLSDARTKRHVY